MEAVERSGGGVCGRAQRSAGAPPGIRRNETAAGHLYEMVRCWVGEAEATMLCSDAGNIWPQGRAPYAQPLEERAEVGTYSCRGGWEGTADCRCTEVLKGRPQPLVGRGGRWGQGVAHEAGCSEHARSVAQNLVGQGYTCATPCS